MSDELTTKQENFALKYVETGNASLAYRHAYEAQDMQQTTIWQEACRTLKIPKVTARIQELKQMAADMAMVTVGTITEELEQARQLAIKVDQPAAMRAASMDKAKLHGLIVDKHEHTGQDGGAIKTEDSGIEAAKRIAFLLYSAAKKNQSE